MTTNQKLEHFLKWVDEQTSFFQDRDVTKSQVLEAYMADPINSAIHDQPTTDNEHIVEVKLTELEAWLAEIRAGKQFKTDAETDIGWIMETIDRITSGNLNIMKMAQKIIMGKLDVEKDLGIDINRMTAIGEKYAPSMAAQLKSKDKKK